MNGQQNGAAVADPRFAGISDADLLAMIDASLRAARPGFTEYAQQAASSFTQGVAEIPAGVVDFVGLVAPFVDRKDAHGFAQQIRQSARELIPEIEGLQGSLSSNVARGVGSGISFLIPGAAAGLAAKAAGASSRAITAVNYIVPGVLGSVVEGPAQFYEAEAAGADEGTKWTAFLGGLGVGATEMVPLGRMLGRINRDSGGGLKRVLVDGLREGVEEAGQETGQQVLGNLLARYTYDEDRELMRGVVEGGTAGFFSGVILSALVSGVAGRGPLAGDKERQGATGADTEPAGQLLDSAGQPVDSVPRETLTLPAQRLGDRDAGGYSASQSQAFVTKAFGEEALAVDATDEEQGRLRQFAEQRGRRVRFVSSPTGSALPRSAAVDDETGTIYLDAGAGPIGGKRALLFHELVHSLRGGRQGPASTSYATLVSDLAQSAPGVVEGFARQYGERYRAAFGREVPDEIREEEGVAFLTENLGAFLDYAFDNPGALEEIATANRTLFQTVVDYVLEGLRRLGFQVDSQELRSLKRLRDRIAESSLEKEADPYLVRQLTLRVRDFLDSTMGEELPALEGPKPTPREPDQAEVERVAREPAEMRADLVRRLKQYEGLVEPLDEDAEAADLAARMADLRTRLEAYERKPEPTPAADERIPEPYRARVAEGIASGSLPQGSITPFDTPEGISARERVAASMSRPTAADDSPERQALRQRIIDELERLPMMSPDKMSIGVGGTVPEGGVRQERKFVFVLGPSAAGKSTIADRLAPLLGGRVIDADMVKAKLPEYRGGEGASLVHEESSGMAEGPLLERALARGDNIVMPMVGKTAAKVERQIELLSKLGYETHLVLWHLPAEKAATRAMARFKKTGRFVDPAYVLFDVADKPLATYTSLRGHPGLSSYAHFSNDVPRGSQAVAVEISQENPWFDGGPDVVRGPAGEQERGPGNRDDAAGARVEGNKTDIELANGTAIPARYVALEADALVPSHDARRGFAANKGGDLNERDYSDPTEGKPYRATVEKIAGKPKPALLVSDTPTAVDGPPITNEQGVVLGGNARSMAMQLAYSRGGEQAEKIRQATIEAAEKFGLDRAAVESMSAPVIIRMVPAAHAGARGELSRILNSALTTTKTATTEAVSRGSKIDEATAWTVGNILADDSVADVLGDARKARDIMAQLVKSGALLSSDVDGMLDPHGALTKAGKDTIEQLLLGAIVPSVRAIAETAPAIRQKLMRALASLVRVRTTWPEFRDVMVNALQAVTSLRQSGLNTIDEARRQMSLIDEPWKNDPLAVALAEKLQTEKQTAFAQRMVSLADELADAASGQGALFARPTRSTAEVFAENVGAGNIAGGGRQERTSADQDAGSRAGTVPRGGVEGSLLAAPEDAQAGLRFALAPATDTPEDIRFAVAPFAGATKLQHGTRQDFESFDPAKAGHGVFYFSKADDFEGRKSQAEYIARGPLGGRMVTVYADLSKLRRFNPAKDDAAREIMERLEREGQIRLEERQGRKFWDFVEYPDMAYIAPAAMAHGYELFRVHEPSVQGFSFAIRADNPELQRVINEQAEPGGPGFYNDLPSLRFALPLAVQDSGKSLRAWLQRNLTARGDLPSPAFVATIARDGWVNAQTQRIENGARDFRRAARKAFGSTKLTAEQEQAVDAVFKGADPTTIPAVLREPTRALRDHVDALSRHMIQAGVVEGELAAKVDRNLGFYATRSYRVFDDPDWAKKVPVEVRNRAKSLLAAEYPDRSDDQIEALIDHLLYEGKAADSPIALLSRSKLGSKDLSILKRREEIAPEIRALYGEYTDPLVNYARSVTKMAHLIGNHKFLIDVRKQGLGTFLFTKPEKRDGISYHVKIAAGEVKDLTSKDPRKRSRASSMVMHPLNGLYTTPEIERAFEEAVTQEQIPDWLRYYATVNAAVKASATIGSIKTQVRNFISNPGFALAQGHLTGPGYEQAFRGTLSKFGAMDDAGWRAYYLNAIERGVIHDTASAGELRDIIRDATKRDLAAFTEHDFRGIAARIAKGAEDAYRASDDFWKIHAWESEKARWAEAHPEWSAEEVETYAAGLVRKTYPTYSHVPRAVKFLRRFPLLGTFVSFPAEVVRVAGNTASLIRSELRDPNAKVRAIGARRLVGSMLAMTAPAAAALAARMLVGMDADDDEAAREFLPPWDQNATILWTGAKDGKPTYINLSYTDPWSYLKKPINAALRGDSIVDAAVGAFQEAADPFLGWEILAEAVLDVSRNKTATGAPVYNEAESFDAIAADVAKRLGEPFVPGTIKDLNRVRRGVTGEVSRWGKAYDPWTELGAMVTGQRVATLDVPQALGFKSRDYQELLSKSTRILTEVASRAGAVTDGEMASAYEEAEDARRDAYETMRDSIHAARAFGLTDNDMRPILDAALSKESMEALLRDRYVPYQPSSSFLATYGTTTKDKAEYKRRRAYVMTLGKPKPQEAVAEE